LTDPGVRAIRAASRKFLEAVDDREGIVVRYGGHPGHWASWRFGGALSEMRGVFGVHVTRIAAQNCLDIEDDLARILPASDAENDGHPRSGSARKKRDSRRKWRLFRVARSALRNAVKQSDVRSPG
jgi:hypothetical protein